MKTSGKKEDEDSWVRNNRINREEVDLNQLVENSNADLGRASYSDGYSDAPTRGSNQSEGNVDRTAIIREFLLDFRLLESNLSNDLHALRGYLRSQSEL